MRRRDRRRAPDRPAPAPAARAPARPPPAPRRPRPARARARPPQPGSPTSAPQRSQVGGDPLAGQSVAQIRVPHSVVAHAQRARAGGARARPPGSPRPRAGYARDPRRAHRRSVPRAGRQSRRAGRRPADARARAPGRSVARPRSRAASAVAVPPDATRRRAPAAPRRATTGSRIHVAPATPSHPPRSARARRGAGSPPRRCARRCPKVSSVVAPPTSDHQERPGAGGERVRHRGVGETRLLVARQHLDRDSPPPSPAPPRTPRRRAPRAPRRWRTPSSATRRARGRGPRARRRRRACARAPSGSSVPPATKPAAEARRGQRGVALARPAVGRHRDGQEQDRVAADVEHRGDDGARRRHHATDTASGRGRLASPASSHQRCSAAERALRQRQLLLAPAQRSPSGGKRP